MNNILYFQNAPTKKNVSERFALFVANIKFKEGNYMESNFIFCKFSVREFPLYSKTFQYKKNKMAAF